MATHIAEDMYVNLHSWDFSTVFVFFSLPVYSILWQPDWTWIWSQSEWEVYIHWSLSQDWHKCWVGWVCRPSKRIEMGPPVLFPWPRLTNPCFSHHRTWIQKFDNNCNGKNTFFLLLASPICESEWNSLEFPVFWIHGGPGPWFVC